MEKLLKVIETVRARIQRHGETLRRNEMLTRYALVDPVLRALGWDTEDPDQVVPEFQTDVGRPDYILRSDQGFQVGVEAKRYGSDEKTFDDARRKALPLFQEQNIRYYVITDGDRWVIWDISRPREERPHPIVDVRVSQDSAGEVTRALLALWRPAMPSVEPAPKSVVPGLEEPRRPLPGPDWVSLAELERRRKQRQWKSGQPQQIRFPDGKTEVITSWRRLLVAVGQWALPKLQQKGRLPLGRLIVKGRGGRREPVGLGGDWYIETRWGPLNCVRKATRILQAVGVEPDRVHVQLRE